MFRSTSLVHRDEYCMVIDLPGVTLVEMQSVANSILGFVLSVPLLLSKSFVGNCTGTS